MFVENMKLRTVKFYVLMREYKYVFKYFALTYRGFGKMICYFSHPPSFVFPDVCSSCSHVIGEHRYEFWVEGGYQEYRMDCMLCGLGEDSVSVMPTDPKKISAVEY